MIKTAFWFCIYFCQELFKALFPDAETIRHYYGVRKGSIFEEKQS